MCVSLLFLRQVNLGHKPLQLLKKYSDIQQISKKFNSVTDYCFFAPVVSHSLLFCRISERHVVYNMTTYFKFLYIFFIISISCESYTYSSLSGSLSGSLSSSSFSLFLSFEIVDNLDEKLSKARPIKCLCLEVKLDGDL